MCSLTVLFLLLTFVCGQTQAKEHTVYWNVSNDGFRHPVESSNSIVVDMDDTIRVVCPGFSAQKRYLKIHKVSALSFNECLLETQKTLVVTCDGSSSSQKPTIIGVRRFSPLPSTEAIVFEPGETYYWIATSTGEREGINQTQRGMCAADNMRLMIHVRRFPEASSVAISVTIPRTSTLRTIQRDPLPRRHDAQINSKFSAIAHSYLYEHRREPDIPNGFTSDQLQKVASLAHQGATGTFSFDTSVEVSKKLTNEPSNEESIYWDTAPLLHDVFSSASDNIVLGSNHVGDEEGAFVVHEDVGRSYEYQSGAVGFTLAYILCATFFVLIHNRAL